MHLDKKHEHYMNIAISYAKQTNQIWPFAAIIVDHLGNIAVKATDCAHISPLFHAEALAIHVYALNFGHNYSTSLTLYSTSECDTLSQSVAYWANVTGIPIKTIVYGSSLESIKEIWPFGINIKADELMKHACGANIELLGPVLEDECLTLFKEAKAKQEAIGKPHPGRAILSKNYEDFFCIYK